MTEEDEQGCECGHPACWAGLTEAQEADAASLVHLLAQLPAADVAAAAARLGSVDAALALLAAEEDWDEGDPTALGPDWVVGRLGWLGTAEFGRAVDALVRAGLLTFDGYCLSFEEGGTAGSAEAFLRGHRQ
jgi:hypothetical protein